MRTVSMMPPMMAVMMSLGLVLLLTVLFLCCIMMSASFDPGLDLADGHPVTVLDCDTAVI